MDLQEEKNIISFTIVQTSLLIVIQINRVAGLPFSEWGQGWGRKEDKKVKGTEYEQPALRPMLELSYWNAT